MEDLNLICTNCNESYANETKDFRCDICSEPLELEEIHKGKIKEGNILKQNILERYKDFFPFLELDFNLSLGEGFTPLINSEKLSKELDVNNIYFKNETVNPTWSFKDRGTLTGVIRAKSLGYTKIGTVSTGNMATSVAAYGAAAGIETIVLVKKEIAKEKLNPIAIYGPKLIKVDGDYDKLYSESLRIGNKKGIYFINSDSPYRVEGYKTIAFEICEQLNFEVPDYVMVPTSAGGNIRGIEKGFREFKKVGLIHKTPKIIAIQAAGCSPIYKGFKNNDKTIDNVNNPNTIAHAIQNSNPPSGNQVLRMLSDNGGCVVAVSDEEIIWAQEKMAKEGIFAQPASVTSLAGIRKLRNENYLNKDDNIVCVVTGAGLKHTSILDNYKLSIQNCKLEELEDLI